MSAPRQNVTGVLDRQIFRSGDSDYMVSLARGLHVIQVFCDGDRSRLTIAEISRRSGLSRTVVSRCLYTLKELGFVGRDGRSFFLLPKVLKLGYGYVSTASLPALSQPLLDRLTSETGTASAAVVLDNNEALYVATSRPSSVRNAVTINTTIGHRRPAFSAASGILLLANLSPAERDAYFEQLDHDEVRRVCGHSPDEIRALVARAGNDDYVFAELPFASSMLGLAVPVRNVVGHVLAALVVAIFDTGESRDALARQYLPRLRRLSKGLSDQLID